MHRLLDSRLSFDTTLPYQTAAHCLANANITSVTLTFARIHRQTDLNYEQVNAATWLIHESFNPDQGTKNDIALVFLNKTVANVSPVDIDFETDIVANDEVTIVGFGFNESGGALTNELREADLTVIGIQVCNANFQEPVNRSLQFCTGGGACSGDSGGPAILKGGVQDSVVGLISFGKPDCEDYTVFTRLKGYEQWIKSRVCGRANDPAWCPAGFVGFGCFSSSSMVLVKGRGSIKMQDLRVGDLVQVGDNIYEPIYSFGHHGPGIKTEMLQIKTDNLSLRLTHDHIVITSAHGPIPAALVKVGDHVVVPPGTAIVREITSVNEEGLYAPFTPSGKLVVDGILVSAYVALEPTEGVRLFGGRWGLLSHHWLSHIVETPHRLVCHDFGMYCPSERYGSDGTNASLTVLLHFGQWVYEQRGTLRVFMMSVVVIVWGTLFLFEQLVLHPFLTAAFVLGLRVVRKCLGKNKLLTK
jgi:hypothetical protein